MLYKKILLFGATGFLGSQILKSAPKGAKLILAYRKRPVKRSGFKQIRLDLTKPISLRKALKAIMPEVIIHASRLDSFDDNPEKTKKFTEDLAKTAKIIGSKLVYVSSDAVFDGRKGNYKEYDRPRPLTDYGKAKLAAETAIRKNLDNHFMIIRPGYIYNDNHKKPDKRTSELFGQIKKGGHVSRFADMYRSPVLVTDLAATIWRLIKKDFSGIVHVAGRRQSVYKFSQNILKKFGFNPNLIKAGMIKNSKIKVARDTSLNTSLIKKVLVPRLFHKRGL